MTNVNAQIQEIIKKRSATMEKIRPEQEKWDVNFQKVETVRRMADALKDSCQKAIQNNGDPEGVLTPLIEALNTTVNNAVIAMKSNVSKAKEELQKLQDRCDRKTINIAVAGVGRSGKSTALKSILNLPQEDNTIIPTGKGAAVTAGKSTIVCVKSKNDECTVIKYHTVDSFLDKLINPFMDSIYQGTKKCYSLDDFINLDLVGYQKKLEDYKPEMNQGVAPENVVPLQTRKVHLSRLLNIQENAKGLEPYLNGLTQKVPLSDTSKYISYQRDEKGNCCGLQLCYAVQEVTIYSQFPNNDIESLKLTDLPGLGTCSESERKCFLEGFNYSVDLALIIRRPEGLFQNYPSVPDMEVNNILCDTFGNKSWEDCAYLFQNDGGLDADAAQKAMAEVDSWKSQGHTMTVTRGSAIDAEFMQKTLLPSVLDYMMNTLPRFDQTLFNEALGALDKQNDEFDNAANEITKALRAAKKNIKCSGDSTKYKNRRAAEIIKVIDRGIQNLVTGSFNETSTERYNALADTIRLKSQELQDKITEFYSPDNEKQVEDVVASYRNKCSLSEYANTHIHELRILITEGFAELENFHAKLLDEMRQAVYEIFTEISSTIFPKEGKLNDVYDRFSSMDTYESIEIVPSAIQDLLKLKAPFYTILYPTLRKELFRSNDRNWITSIEKRFRRIEEWIEKNPDKPIEELGQNTLIECQNLGIEWVCAAEMILQNNLMVPALISAALERFQDRVDRSEAAKEEITTFVDYYWGEIQNNSDAYLRDIGDKTLKIMELLDN